MFSIEIQGGKTCNGLMDTELKDPDLEKSIGNLGTKEKATFWTQFKVPTGQTAKTITLQATYKGDTDVTTNVPSRLKLYFKIMHSLRYSRKRINEKV